MGDKGKIRIQNYDMNEGTSFPLSTADMKQKAQEFVMSIEKGKAMDQDLAKKLKTEFDMTFHPTWHCIVGNAIGWGVTGL